MKEPTLYEFVQHRLLPDRGVLCVAVFLESTAGFIVHDKHTAARRALKWGKYRCPVPGHGGDAVVVDHDDGTVACYWTKELVTTEKTKQPVTCKYCNGSGKETS